MDHYRPVPALVSNVTKERWRMSCVEVVIFFRIPFLINMKLCGMFFKQC